MVESLIKAIDQHKDIWYKCTTTSADVLSDTLLGLQQAIRRHRNAGTTAFDEEVILVKAQKPKEGIGAPLLRVRSNFAPEQQSKNINYPPTLWVKDRAERAPHVRGSNPMTSCEDEVSVALT